MLGNSSNSINIVPYLRLMRWHQPVGYWLLLWPCWWSITLASYHTHSELPTAKLLALFLIGAIAMRSAGCIINDIWDRKLDARVARTTDRPLASGVLSVRQAVFLLLILLIIACAVLLQLNLVVFLLSIIAILLVIIYPYMKRITWWPQAFLGATFNFGALMGWAAVSNSIDAPAITLYLAGIFWTLGYDTIYAHQDRDDDIIIGIKSTARLLTKYSRLWIALFYSISLIFLVATGLLLQLPYSYYIVIAMAALHLYWQAIRLDINSSESCLFLFRQNIYTGFLIWLATISAYTAM